MSEEKSQEVIACDKIHSMVSEALSIVDTAEFAKKYVNQRRYPRIHSIFEQSEHVGQMTFDYLVSMYGRIATLTNFNLVKIKSSAPLHNIVRMTNPSDACIALRSAHTRMAETLRQLYAEHPAALTQFRLGIEQMATTNLDTAKTIAIEQNLPVIA